MDIGDIYRKIADHINAGTCIAVVGAGISATCEFNGKKYLGLPLARDIVADLKSKRDYLHDAQDLGEVAFLFRENEGRAELEKYLLERLNVKGIEPLPAHNYLATLQLPCYISMNFDNLLERALTACNQKLLPVCADEDVSLHTPTDILVIKPHGSVDLPKSMCIAMDETFSFEERIPIVTHFLLSWLSNRMALFVGFSLSDRDFLELIRYLKSKLGKYMPHSIAVMRSKRGFLQKFWDQYNVQIVDSDATEFLFETHKRLKQLKFQLVEDLEPWMRNQFFWQLLEIRGLPTETQVIDALLREIKERISAGEKIELLEKEVSEAISLVLRYRPNRSALKSIGEELSDILRRCKEQNLRLWDEFGKLEKRRKVAGEQISSQASAIIGSARSILIYSQSQRVTDFLGAVDPSLQKLITLFIGECRVKSPANFQDAMAFARQLRNTHYTIRLIPDVGMFHLLKKKKFDLVLLGAHMVFQSKETEEYEYFVNTCGSEAIVDIACKVDIPVNVIFEREKVVRLFEKSQLESVSYEPEEIISSEAVRTMAEEPTLSERLRVENIGYDLVQWRKNVSAVTDEKLET
jgi:translation initiation factor 2B subunit (eIF-2B alpha/beta/delta family)